MIEYVDSATGEVIDLDAEQGLARAVLSQESRLDRLTQLQSLTGTTVQALQDQIGDSFAAGFDGMSAWDWSTLGPHGAQELWRRLELWVGWLRGRYPVAEQLPGCWWRHPELVEEITALHLAWRAAYSDPAALLTAPIEWHAHHLPAFLSRVRGWGVHCTDTHRDRPASAYAASAVDDLTAFHAYTADDVEARRRNADTRHERWSSDSPPADPTPDAGGSAVAMATPDMTALLATGQATPLTGAPGSPVHHDGGYWLPDGQRYVRVDDDSLHDQLRRDHDRLHQADGAVRRNMGDGDAER